MLNGAELEEDTNLSVSLTLQYTNGPGQNVAGQKKPSSPKQEKLKEHQSVHKLEQKTMNRDEKLACRHIWQVEGYKTQMELQIKLTEKKVDASSSPSVSGTDNACLKSRRAINCQLKPVKMRKTNEQGLTRSDNENLLDSGSIIRPIINVSKNQVGQLKSICIKHVRSWKNGSVRRHKEFQWTC